MKSFTILVILSVQTQMKLYLVKTKSGRDTNKKRILLNEIFTGMDETEISDVFESGVDYSDSKKNLLTKLFLNRILIIIKLSRTDLTEFCGKITC